MNSAGTGFGVSAFWFPFHATEMRKPSGAPAGVEDVMAELVAFQSSISIWQSFGIWKLADPPPLPASAIGLAALATLCCAAGSSAIWRASLAATWPVR